MNDFILGLAFGVLLLPSAGWATDYSLVRQNGFNDEGYTVVNLKSDNCQVSKTSGSAAGSPQTLDKALCTEIVTKISSLEKLPKASGSCNTKLHIKAGAPKSSSISVCLDQKSDFNLYSKTIFDIEMKMRTQSN